MIIREAEARDIPEIVALLKLSLGESIVPKSHRYWKWKHLLNPFGKSPVLIAVQDSELVGVRAFMRWNWTYQGGIIKSLRAVDTATHPNHRGKGIFRKLTMALVEKCLDEGYDFIYNTPNEFSRPGYLKMGWTILKRFAFRIKLINPVSAYACPPNSVQNEMDWRHLDSIFRDRNPTNAVKTCYSSSYLKWRYEDNPICHYRIGFNKKKECFAFSRIKSHSYINEIRLCDLFLFDEGGLETENKWMESIWQGKKALGCTIGEWPKDFRTHSPVLHAGPQITFKGLNMTEFPDLQNWHPSIGDMEVF